MDIVQKIRDGDYKNPIEWVGRGSGDETRRAQRAKYDEAEIECLRRFKADVIASENLTDHPKADRAYEMAWDDGHSEGLESVYYSFVQLAELLK
jgi:hypothetical protein